ncbi:MAG: ABC transporter ATP-binding protein [Fretibacterium sp.]|nr:ABC transporter ATP-binding protein [Fretibacterium sp.]
MSAILEVKDLCKSFRGLKAVSDVSLTAEEGAITGMIGPNGAGKSTTFNMICGFYPPTSGKIYYRGRDITGLRAYQFADMGIARTFQIMKPLGNLTVLDNVASGAFFGRHKAGSLHQAREIAEGILEFTGLDAKRNVLAREMGTPDQKRLEVARALATKPDMLFLDEAMAGLNPTETEDAIALIRRINEGGVTIFLIEHIMRAVVSLCGKVVVLHHGEKIAEGTPEQVMNDPTVMEVYLGAKPLSCQEKGAPDVKG